MLTTLLSNYKVKANIPLYIVILPQLLGKKIYILECKISGPISPNRPISSASAPPCYSKKNAATKQIPEIDSFDTKEQVPAHCITWKNRVVFVQCQYSRIVCSFTVIL